MSTFWRTLRPTKAPEKAGGGERRTPRAIKPPVQPIWIRALQLFLKN